MAKSIYILLTALVVCAVAATAYPQASLNKTGDYWSFSLRDGDVKIAEYRFYLVTLEPTGDEFDARLPDGDTWLVCDHGYTVLFFERVYLADGYLEPITGVGFQLIYEDGATEPALYPEDVVYSLSDELQDDRD